MSDAAIPARTGVELDHLVVACATLDDGRAWCESTFGVAASPGGNHPKMGTHNLLIATSSARFPRSYIEIIAIDPEAPEPTRPRWFELDEPSLRAKIASGPRLVHWVARSSDIEAAASAWRQAGFNPGAITDAERMTARGMLRWRIALTDGGVRHADGAVPLLIEWGDVHPSDSLPSSGIELRSLRVGGIGPALAALMGVEAADEAAAPSLVAELATPRGAVTLIGA